jgi:2-keto-4-pentenoate hydratase
MRYLVMLWFLTSGQLLAADVGCSVDQARLRAAVEDFRARKAQQPLPLPLEGARCFRRAFVHELSLEQGVVVGYKVGLYTETSRKTFGASGPEIGTLLKGMLVEHAREVSAAVGFSPVAEADFMLVVGSDAINEARTREDFYRQLRGYRPFIELPDNNYPPNTPVSAGQLVALNVNARAGILGKEVPLVLTSQGQQDLVGLSVVASIEGGESPKKQEGVARETLGDPIDIAMFARDAVLREGRRLRTGDLISIGAIVTPSRPHSGETFRVSYRIGKTISEISVFFTP